MTYFEKLTAFCGLLGMIGLLAACSGSNSFTYPDDGPHNFFARVSGIKNGFLENRDVNIAIYSEEGGEACNFQYDGTIVLKESDQGIRIPLDRPIIAQVNFIFTDLFDDADSMNSYNYVFVPRAGRKYRAEVKQDAVGLTTRILVDDPSGTYREVDLVPRESCGPVQDEQTESANS